MFLNSIILSAAAGATHVKGPDGYALLAALLIVLAIPLVWLVYRLIRPGSGKRGHKIFRARRKVEITLQKDRMYYPDYLKVSIRNTGRSDVDLDRPMIIFRDFWSKRKFIVKGTNRYSFYPLLLEPGKVHDLTIDLNHFYRHDKRLKRFARVTFVVREVNGRQFKPRSIMLRKTLFR